MQDSHQLSEHLYLLPIGGTAMAPLAGLLLDSGHRVEGVDSQLYPPMSALLEELGVPVRIGFDPAGPPAGVDRVIIGNAVPRTNPEVEAVLRRRVPFLSQAEAVSHYLLARGQQSVVVAGTHGKTTTSAMLSFILERAGADPSYLVGGLLPWSGRSYRLGRGAHMVIEGDEYNTAFFDRGPKFLHYRSHLFVLGPVEFDHADLYRDLDAVLTAYRAGTAQVPRDGGVVVSGFSPAALSAVRDTTAPVVVVGPGPGADLEVAAVRLEPERSVAAVAWRGAPLEVTLPLAGEHNLHNACMALAAALLAGVAEAAAVDALACFPGVVRRLETVGEAAGVTVVDDFAHHPTALGVTIAAARQRWPGRRLVVAFEPRSISAARREFQDGYGRALAAADVVLVAAPYHRGRIAPEEQLDRGALAAELERRGGTAVMPAPEEDPVERILDLVRPGDVVVGCSSGDFGGFHRRLLASLGGRGAEGRRPGGDREPAP
jgi:UDP-N-acetylmuramate: L-alanyl-gamma-D-glutamyl-meso-diaminopimelate ligase